MSYGMVSGVSRGMGVLGGWRSAKARGSFGRKCGALTLLRSCAKVSERIEVGGKWGELRHLCIRWGPRVASRTRSFRLSFRSHRFEWRILKTARA